MRKASRGACGAAWPFLSPGVSPWRSLQPLSEALRAPPQMRRDGEQMKTQGALSSGTQASKASWQFQRVFILDAAFAASVEFSALSWRAIQKAGSGVEKAGKGSKEVFHQVHRSSSVVQTMSEC